MSKKPRILVLGGGFGGLESLFYLKHVLGDRGGSAWGTRRNAWTGTFRPDSGTSAQGTRARLTVVMTSSRLVGSQLVQNGFSP